MSYVTPAILLALALPATGCAPVNHSPAARSSTATPSDLWTRAGGDDWPGFLGPGRDGKSAETGFAFDWGPTGPPLVWQREIGDGYSMPSVAGGRLFLFDRHDDKARLTCLNAETGAELWRAEYETHYEDMYEFSNGPRSSPLVDGEFVYTFGVEGQLRCHRVIDGSLVWEIDTASRYHVVQSFFGVGSTPVIEGELLIVPVGGSPPDSPGILSGDVQGNGSGIVAFDRQTGEQRYAITDELASYASPVIATLGDRRWAFAFMRSGLVAFEPGSGRVDFQFPWRARKLESVNAANPVVVGEQVLLSESYGPGSVLLRIESGGAEVVWKDPRRDGAMRTHWMTPIHHEGLLYGCSGSGSGDAEFRAVEWKTGRVVWRHKGLGRFTLLYVDRHLLALGERGTLTVVRADPGEYRQVAQWRPVSSESGEPLLAFPAWNAPALSHGLLYVRGADRMICLDLRRTDG